MLQSHSPEQFGLDRALKSPHSDPTAQAESPGNTLWCLCPCSVCGSEGTPGGAASAASPMGCFADGLSTDVLPSFLFPGL